MRGHCGPPHRHVAGEGMSAAADAASKASLEARRSGGRKDIGPREAGTTRCVIAHSFIHCIVEGSRRGRNTLARGIQSKVRHQRRPGNASAETKSTQQGAGGLTVTLSQLIAHSRSVKSLPISRASREGTHLILS